MLLKPNMVLLRTAQQKATSDASAAATLTVLRRTVPTAVPRVNFLSGGQETKEATANLNGLNRQGERSLRRMSISYGRALQQSALRAWVGKSENAAAVQQALLTRIIPP